MLHKTYTSANSLSVLIMVFINAIILKISFINQLGWHSSLYVTLPVLVLAIYGSRHAKHAKQQHQRTSHEETYNGIYFPRADMDANLNILEKRDLSKDFAANFSQQLN